MDDDGYADGQVYAAEFIMKKREKKGGKLEYLVKWKGESGQLLLERQPKALLSFIRLLGFTHIFRINRGWLVRNRKVLHRMSTS